MSTHTTRRFAAAAAALGLIASAVAVGSITAPGQILALPGASESTVVTVEPTRILDTRYNIGLTGQFVANTSRKLTATGVIDTYIEATATTTVKEVIPAGATGVLLNVTAVSPTAVGFLSIRPGNATGVAATAGLNFNAGDVVPNAITVAMPITGANAGQIDIYYGTPTTGATMHVVADVVGYTTNTGLTDLTNRLLTLETSGVAGPQGPAGANGPVVGSACAADGIAGTVQSYFDPVTGAFAIRCSRPAYVSTVAGTAGITGSANGNGTSAGFAYPTGIAVDASGNVYVADGSNHLIRKITPSGEVTTLAGAAGSSGSANGNGAAARFNAPAGVAVDGSGNVYVADTSNHLIRKITPTGDVTTLAGTASSFGWADGNGAAARFYHPWGVAVDGSGNVYVADQSNHLIRKITPSGDVSTLAGAAGSSGSVNGNGAAARFYNPAGIGVDSSGNVYVADGSNHLIRKITPSGGVTTLAGTAGSSGSANGNGAAARFNLPFGLAVDASGNVYVGDTFNHLVRKITPSGGVTTLAGTAGSGGSANGNGAAARFQRPFAVAATGSGNVYVADGYNHLIRKIG